MIAPKLKLCDRPTTLSRGDAWHEQRARFSSLFFSTIYAPKHESNITTDGARCLLILMSCCWLIYLGDTLSRALNSRVDGFGPTLVTELMRSINVSWFSRQFHSPEHRISRTIMAFIDMPSKVSCAIIDQPEREDLNEARFVNQAWNDHIGPTIFVGLDLEHSEDGLNQRQGKMLIPHLCWAINAVTIFSSSVTPRTQLI